MKIYLLYFAINKVNTTFVLTVPVLLPTRTACGSFFCTNTTYLFTAPPLLDVNLGGFFVSNFYA